MRRLIGMRLLQLIPVLLGVTFLSFALVNLLPGNVANFLLGDNATPATIHQLDVRLGLNRPIAIRYIDWLGNTLHGNLGQSLTTGQPVSSAIRAAFPATLELMIFAEVSSLILCVIFAFLSVWTRSKVVDRAVTIGALVGHCNPSFMIGLLFLLLFTAKLKLVTAVGYVPFSQGIFKNLAAMSLPGVTLALGIFPTQMRVFRAEMVEQLDNEEYVALARMKHLSKARIIFRHVAKNSAASLVTVTGLSVGFLLGGAVVVEQVFSIYGIGSLLLTAINSRDAPMVEGIVLFVACVVVFVNLVADLIYVAIDPRIRPDA